MKLQILMIFAFVTESKSRKNLTQGKELPPPHVGLVYWKRIEIDSVNHGHKRIYTMGNKKFGCRFGKAAVGVPSVNEKCWNLRMGLRHFSMKPIWIMSAKQKQQRYR